MDAHDVTLADFLGLDDGALETRLAEPLAGSDTMALARAALSPVPAPLRKYAAASVGDTLKGALDTPLTDVLATAWNTRRDLRTYLDRSKYPPDETVHHVLMKHAITSTHRPKLQLTVDGAAVGPAIEFEVELTFALDSAMLDIRDGRIWAAHPGHCQGKGRIACEGAVLVERKTEKLALPGTLRFQGGIAIGERYGAEAAGGRPA